MAATAYNPSAKYVVATFSLSRSGHRQAGRWTAATIQPSHLALRFVYALGTLHEGLLGGKEGERVGGIAAATLP